MVLFSAYFHNTDACASVDMMLRERITRVYRQYVAARITHVMAQVRSSAVLVGYFDEGFVVQSVVAVISEACTCFFRTANLAENCP